MTVQSQQSPKDLIAAYLHRLGIRLSLTWHRIKGGWGIFRESPLAMLGLILIIIFGIMAIAHPILIKTVWPSGIYDPETGFDGMVMHPAPPSSRHILGTDILGRDVLSMLLAATTPTFILGITAALTTAIIGILLAMIAAFYGGIVDSSISRVSDLFLLLPAPIMMVIIGARFREIGPAPLGLFYGLIAGIGIATVVLRSHGLKIMKMPYIEAARVSGGGATHIIFKHLTPHMLPLAALLMMTAVTGAVIADGFIAFLGFSREYMNWGTIIYNSFTYSSALSLEEAQWNVLIPPALALSLFALAFYLVSRGVHQFADPRSTTEHVRKSKRKFFKVPELLPVIKSAPKPAVATTTEATIPLVDIPIYTRKSNTFLQCRIRIVASSLQKNRLLQSKDASYDALLDAMRIVSAHGGTLSHADTDSFLAYFGQNQEYLPSRVAALLATHAGTALREHFEYVNLRRANQNLPEVHVGIGIASGMFIHAINQAKEYKTSIAFEETVKTAEKLQEYSFVLPKGGMLISDTTFENLESVRGQFYIGRSGPARFPWSASESMIYEVTGRNVAIVKHGSK